MVSEPAQLRALSDEVRGRIVALLRERAASASELAGLLNMPKGTVGHHLKVLERAGLVHVVRTRRVRAVTEKYYGRVARLFLYKSRDEQDDELLHGVGATSLRIAAAEIAAAPEVGMHALLRVRLDAGGSQAIQSPARQARGRRCGPPRRPTASRGASSPPSTGRLGC